jgi:cytoskeleton protein RodZ
MTDSGTGPVTAGNILREARERQGLHIAMLAATMKVPPKKLEALEQGRLDQLPDLAFARALAKSVCRNLKIEPDQVLSLMPNLNQPEGLVKAANGLATPYENNDAPSMDNDRWGVLRRPVFWATLLVLGAAGTIFFAPQPWLDRFKPAAWLTKDGVTAAGTGSNQQPNMVSQTLGGAATASPTQPVKGLAGTAGTSVNPGSTVAALPASSQVPGADASLSTAPSMAAGPMGPQRPEPTGAPVVETVHSAPGTAAMPEGATADIVVRASQASWVEVTDGKGESLIRRSIQKDETVNMSGTPPYRVRLGNVLATELRYKGETVDIRSKSVGNVIRFELK